MQRNKGLIGKNVRLLSCIYKLTISSLMLFWSWKGPSRCTAPVASTYHRWASTSKSVIPMGSARQIYGSILLQTVFKSLHKPRDNLRENLFSKKCAFKNNLQLSKKSFCLKLIQHLKMAFYLAKWPIFKNLQYFSN
jgi:hypothetical protein